jgi:putative DNA primase/helicase
MKTGKDRSHQPPPSVSEYLPSPEETPPAENPHASAPQPDDQDRAEIERLAKLPLLTYERERKEAAKRLGITRPSVLDKIVEARRPKEDDDEQGIGIAWDEPEPWEEPVSGAALLSEIAAYYRRHLILPPCADVLLSLWTAHTWTWMDVADFSPLLHVRGPTERCGKSRVGEVAAKLVRRPLSTASATAAAVFRVIASHGPTIILDEIDNLDVEAQADLLAVINDGYRRGGAVLRVAGDDHEVRQFAVFSPKMLIGIGKVLPPTTVSRAIPIAMRRKLPSEKVEPFRESRSLPEAPDTRRRLRRWSEDIAEDLAGRRPAPVAGISDRHNDVWEPLLALAEAAGGKWPTRAREAAVALCGGETPAADDALGVRLLRDIEAAFVLDGVVRMTSGRLCDLLLETENSPWGEFARGKGLSKSRLARFLSDFGIASKDIRTPDDKVLKGYYKEDLQDAFSRYLPESPVSKRNNATSLDSVGESSLFQNATAPPCSVSENAVSANAGAACSVVAFPKEDSGQETEFGQESEVDPPLGDEGEPPPETTSELFKPAEAGHKRHWPD